jgi:stage V sporulation protein AD
MKRTIKLQNPPYFINSASVVGRREHEGPYGACFDLHDDTERFGQKTWELAESEMQRLALSTALKKADLQPDDVDALFAGDLLNQCVGSSYGLTDFQIPFLGIFGACSTAVEGLALASLMISGGNMEKCAVVCSSHNCSAERQFRFPIEYGGQRPPTAQWTVTAAAAFLLGRQGKGPKITEVMIGRAVDKSINDANNMGAAMAPAAIDTLTAYFDENNKTPEDFDLIITGDLGAEGSGALCDFMRERNYDLDWHHHDCGLLIYDREKTDVHAGGSGCGCCGSMLASHFLNVFERGDLHDVLFIATGALMNAASLQQGQSIPGIAHLIRIQAQ